MHPDNRGFSLVEVVIALGIVATALLVAAGVAGSLGAGIARAREGEQAATAAEAMLAHLRQLEFAEVASALVTTAEMEALGRNPAGAPDSRLLWSSRAGDRVLQAGDPAWTAAGARPFFEAALVRDESMSPAADDALAACLVFQLRMRWPLHSHGGSPPPRVLVLSGSIRR